MVLGQRSFSELIGEYLSPCTGVVLIITVALSVALVALFVLHSLSIWLSTDPEKAFHNGVRLIGTLERGWDGARFLWNTGMEGLEFAAIGNNRVAKHMVEPAINIGLEVLTQIAFHKHYEGVVVDSIDSVPFRGHYCAEPTRDEDGKVVDYDVSSMTMQSLEFCTYGDVDTWADALGAAKESDPAGMLNNGSTMLLSTQHARRLAFKFGLPKTALKNTGSMFPRVPLGPLFGALGAFTGIQALLWTTQMDIIMHVAFTVLSETAIALFNIAQTIIKAVISLVQVTLRSGILQNLLRMGLDLLMTLVTHVLLPMLFAFLDMVMCLFGFAQPGTWDAQLVCIEKSCFQESGSIGSEIFTVFTSIPIVSHAVVNAVEALINPKTGRKYGESATGPSETPDIPSNGVHESAAAATCAACFACRVCATYQHVQSLLLLI